MAKMTRAVSRSLLLISLLVPLANVAAQDREIPDALNPWKAWATWDDTDQNSPSAYNDFKDRIRFWPTKLELDAKPQSGSWKVAVSVFSDSWMPLPGNASVWPQNVKIDDIPIAVVERGGRPCVRLKPGRYELAGEFAWQQMPQWIPVPKEIGLLQLTVNENVIALPNWDSDGRVWLQRTQTAETEKDLMTVQVYRVIEDGIPVWLRTNVELTVSGKSREESIGWILPEGWMLATVDSKLPVAVDDQGRVKAQVRAGKWIISFHAFAANDVRSIGFAEAAEPVAANELVGFQSNPEFRLAEVTGLPAVDVTQTTFPDQWRHLPVFLWDTTTKIEIDEKTRGMGLQRPEGLTIQRRFWLGEDGKSITYFDRLSGRKQRIWRLDVADGQELGAVRVDGKGQLITTNPAKDSHGVELRTRNLNIEAVGRISDSSSVPATGWQTDVDSLDVTLNLPPGWRMFALFGADDVEGDWLTAWSLLDLFLLLIFGIAVLRIWGVPSGIVAFVAFGLAFHEPGAPRLTWLFLLIPVVLLRVVPDGHIKKWIHVWKYAALALLLINLVPFIALQIQNSIYPQLETPRVNYESGYVFETALDFDSAGLMNDQSMSMPQATKQLETKQFQSNFGRGNFLYDSKSRIQTGPALPDWTWNQVHCHWDGPVSADQKIRPILISLNQNRAITVVRIASLLLLAGILLGVRKLPSWLTSRRAATTAALVMVLCGAGTAGAQEIPDRGTLNQLRDRLLRPSDAFPRAAEIPGVKLKLAGNKVTMQAEIHAAIEVAVPLPGRLPTWSPVSVTVDGEPAELVCRKQEYLWIVLSPGVHQVVVESLLPEQSEWNWTFLLNPRTVSVDAPGWTVTGIGPNGVPEQQLFFAREQKTTEDAATYDRKEFSGLVAIDRHVEAGLIWQVRNEVTRLSPGGKALSVKVPRLPGESILSSNVTVEGDFVEVRLSAGQDSFAWNSELPVGADIELTAAETDQWVERWHLLTSPVWNMSRSGLAPIFEADEQDLIPVWHPWPGEQVQLSFSKPEAVAGETITVQRVHHETSLGSRQRNSELRVELECTLGTDFLVRIGQDAQISSVQVGGLTIPVRRDGDHLIVPIQPGKQTVEITWRTDKRMNRVSTGELIQLPVDAANITTIVNIPESRWILWTRGPMRGPGVRFWVILVFAILAALILGGLKFSPLGRVEWVLLVIGLTQVHWFAAALVVVWLFLLGWRGQSDSSSMVWWRFNVVQTLIVLATVIGLSILIFVVGAGLLGHPQMFVIGNGSSPTFLKWFQPQANGGLPEPQIISISVWFYRLLMLFWALWLAVALLRWLVQGWKSFGQDGYWRSRPPVPVEPEIVFEEQPADASS